MFQRFGTQVLRAFFGLAIATLSASAQRAPLTAHVPQIVKDRRAVRVGFLPASETLRLVISLPLRNQPEIDGLMADLYNPQSPNYRHWLTPAAFDAQFGPTEQDYAALIAWARGSGLAVVSKSGNRHILTVSGTTPVVDRAFHVQLTIYHDPGANRDFHAPDREPSLDLEVPVLAVSGLDTSQPKHNNLLKDPHATTSPGQPAAASGRGATPGSRAGRSAPMPQSLGSGPNNTYLPSDMRAAYYGSGPLTGAGQTVAIFSFDGYLASDLSVYYTNTGTTSSVPVTNVLTGGYNGACQSPCDDGEQILDIVQVQGMAPGLSQILFYEGDYAVTELNQMVSDDTAAVISSSWAGGDFGPATEPLFQQMALQGQTYLTASGDSGAYNAFTYAAPGSSPFVTVVGGTDLETASAGGPWLSETAWAYSGGGYFDPLYVIPSWQQTSGVINGTNAGSATLRNSPDLAAEANFDNTTVSNGAFSGGYGGTSYATPRLAGYMALANQQSVANGYGTIGAINPLLYQLGLRSTASSTYHDISSGSAPATQGPATAYNAVAGYDLVTGWGSPNGPGLLNALTGPDFSLAVNPSFINVVRGTSATVAITIAPLNGFSGSPSFSVSGLPTGVTASFTTNSATSVTMTLTSDPHTLLGTDYLTVTGVSGAITHIAAVTLITGKRPADDFTISATNASVAQLTTGTSTVSVSRGVGLAGPITLVVSGLPTGVTANLSVSPTFDTSVLTFAAAINSAPGSYAVTVTGTAGFVVVHSTTLTLTIAPAASVVANGGFETGSNSPWTGSTTGQPGLAVVCDRTCGNYPHSGTYYAYLDGYGKAHTDRMYQTITLSGGTNSATLNFWLWVSSLETTTTAKNDTLSVQVLNPSGAVLGTLARFSNLDQGTGYVLYSYDMSAYLGQTVRLQFTGTENGSLGTGFLLDDISVVVR